MEGDGPINGTQKHTKLMVMGIDLAAVDATCARIMKFEPQNLSYIRVAGQVIGNIESENIDIIGTPLSAVAQDFARPITYSLDKNQKDWRLLGQPGEQAS
jgi:uncharacterized protein (DUF362 family)